jgi:hypothetical protein
VGRDSAAGEHALAHALTHLPRGTPRTGRRSAQAARRRRNRRRIGRRSAKTKAPLRALERSNAPAPSHCAAAPSAPLARAACALSAAPCMRAAAPCVRRLLGCYTPRARSRPLLYSMPLRLHPSSLAPSALLNAPQATSAAALPRASSVRCCSALHGRASAVCTWRRAWVYAHAV